MSRWLEFPVPVDLLADALRTLHTLTDSSPEAELQAIQEAIRDREHGPLTAPLAELVHVRIQALRTVVDDPRLGRWVRKDPNQQTKAIKAALLKAAGMEPIMPKANGFSFDIASLSHAARRLERE